MKFEGAFLVTLLAGLANAAPGTEFRRRRAESGHKLINHVQGPTNTTEVSYSSNWAGAVLVGTGYTSVTATFTVPTPKSAGSGSAWVGIDGDTCGTAILQTGIDWTKSGSSITYDAWYEWYPNYAYDFSTLTISEGDSVTVTVTASSKTAGKAKIKNNTTGKTVTHSFSNEASEGSLCEYNAEWIVEDFEEGSSLVSFADFGSVVFTSASATQSGSTVGITGAQIIDIEQSSKVLTDASITSSSQLTVTYV
ncbi:hypothetical protein HK100_006206 [Physocladia obscura]|uniref:Uncharacterized protein n=1 Tax=Physocladia obscura TaxID=109957 RepID=A0AAD5SS69_9FUNG|nr:hypothetical protein HK100_006206 [Physocladia obscura]